MPRNKTLDQLLLLVAGIAMSVALFWVWPFMELRGISNRMGFFIVFNVLGGFVLTWQGVASLRRMPGFWLVHGCWAIAHAFVYGAWAYSGNRIELCAFTLPLEAYWYIRVVRGRFLRNLEAARLSGGTSGSANADIVRDPVAPDSQ